MPANKALTVALSISNYWRKHAIDIIPENRRSEEDKLKPPSLSLGLLICPSTFPLYFMYNLAEQLLQKAKTERSRLKAPEGFLDFLILKSSGVPRVEAGQIQKALYWYQEQGSWGENSLRLTERPYGLSAFVRLVRTARALKEAGMVRTHRHALAHSLRLGRSRSTMEVLLYWARRSERDEHGRRISECLKEWQAYLQRESDRRLVFPWRQSNRPEQETTWTTQLLDVLELVDWVEELPDDATGYNGDVGDRDSV